MAITRARRKRQIKNVLKWAGFCLVFLTMGFHVLVKFWLGPVYVESQVKQTLSEFWEGPVRAGEVEFGYDGVMLLRDVIFYDRFGTEVIKAGNIRMVLGDWPSLTSPAKRIEIEKLDVRLRLKGGKPIIPLRFPHNQEITQTNLEYIGVKQATVRIENGGSGFVFDRLTAEVSNAGGKYELNITGAEEGDFNRLRAHGVFYLESGNVEMELKFARAAQRDQTEVLLSAIGALAIWGCEGKVDADLRVQGNIGDTNSLRPEGIVAIEGWTIWESQHIIGRDVNGVLTVGKHRLDLDRFSGMLYNGNFNSSFHLDMTRPGPAEYGGDILAAGIDMAELTKHWETAKRFTRGTGLLNLKFVGDTNGIESLHGSGGVLIDDADLWRFPVIGALFKSIGIWEYQVGGMSDAEIVFTLSGSQIIIERGRLSNKFSAIDVETNGKIDLRSGQIDIYVVALPLKNLEKVINKVPVVNWFIQVKDKLIRLHFKGHWSEPASKLVAKEPIKDVKDGTKAFFKAMIDTGGQLLEKIQSGFKFFFEPDGKIPKD